VLINNAAVLLINGQPFAGVGSSSANGEAVPNAISSNTAYKQLLAVGLLK
jgi:hypothetical protein